MTPWEFYFTYSHPLIEVLLDLSIRGVRVDQELRTQATQEYETQEENLRGELKGLCGETLDPLSPKSLQEYFYTKLGIAPVYRDRVGVKGKSRTPSLDEDAIEEILTRPGITQHTRDALNLVLKIRGTRKLLSTYLRAPLDTDGRLRCAYDLTGTKTGRLSSRETPSGTGTNLQNVPHGICRRMVLPDPGLVFLGADLSQAEARVVAYLSREKRLIEVFDSGGDIHRRNASTLFRKQEGEITQEERSLAKKLVHASNYGIGPVKFAREAGITRGEARALLDLYFNTYPRLKVWHLEIQDTLKRTRTLTTPLGRTRQFMDAWSDDLLRDAYAFVPQSTVSDILNSGLLQVYRGGEIHKRGGEVVLQVHDSIVLQCPLSEVDSLKVEVVKCLTRPVEVNGQTCVIPVTLKIGTNWDEV